MTDVNDNNRYTATVIEIDDDYYLEFPEEVIEQLGWDEGDVLEWKDNEDGTWAISKKESNN